MKKMRIAEKSDCLKTLAECKKCGSHEHITNSPYGGKNYYCLKW